MKEYTYTYLVRGTVQLYVPPWGYQVVCLPTAIKASCHFSSSLATGTMVVCMLLWQQLATGSQLASYSIARSQAVVAMMAIAILFVLLMGWCSFAMQQVGLVRAFYPYALIDGGDEAVERKKKPFYWQLPLVGQNNTMVEHWYRYGANDTMVFGIPQLSIPIRVTRINFIKSSLIYRNIISN